MARVTVEDCMETITDRFDLVALAAQRAKQIASGAALTIDRDNDKDAVVALREIAEKTVNIDGLREDVISSYSSFKMSESTNLHDDDQDYEELMMLSEVDEGMLKGRARIIDEDEEEVDENFSFEDVEDEDTND